MNKIFRVLFLFAYIIANNRSYKKGLYFEDRRGPLSTLGAEDLRILLRHYEWPGEFDSYQK